MATTKKISEYTALTTPASGDLLEIVDVSDTTDAPTGTNKKIAVSDLVSGSTVPDDSITNAKLANMAQSTIKGRAAGAGTGDPVDLTATQATAILNNVVGDSGSGGTKGLVPAPGAGDAAAGKFLKSDGTFAVPPGTGGGLTADSVSAPVFAADAGSNDTYVATLSPVPSGYTTGTHYRFKANTANTGAATINFNSLGAKTIKKVAGGITTDLADNDIRAGQWVDLVYDGTNMQMQSTLGNAPASGAAINATDTYIPRRSNSTTFADSFLSHDAANTQTKSDGHILINSNTSKILGFGTATAISGIANGGDGVVKPVTTGVGNPGVFLSATVASSGTSITPWTSLGQVFRLVMTGNATINRPQQNGGSNSVSGEILTIILVQDGTGGRTVTWASEYKWVGGTAPTVTSTANAVCIFRFWVDGSNQAWEISRALDVK
jgi:hypothetical protein